MSNKFFNEQQIYTNTFFLDYMEKNLDLPTSNKNKFRILEVGCAEGGMLSILNQKGFSTSGIEIEQSRIEIAKTKDQNSNYYLGDISDPSIVETIKEQFDFIIMRDVIEHIPNKRRAFENINKLMKENGHLFVAFPLKYSPFAGHQQVCRTGLKKVIYITMFPDWFIKFLGKIFKEHESMVEHIIDNKRNALSHYSLNKLVKNLFSYSKKDFYLFRPVFKVRFNLPIVKFINIVPFRELALGNEVLLKKKGNS